MRAFPVLLAALLLAAPAAALTPNQRTPVLSGGSPQHPAPVPAAQPSAFFGYNNSQFGGTVNNGLQPPSGWANVPSTVINSWTLVVHFKFEDNTLPYYSGVNTPFGLLANCAISACTTSTPKTYIQVTNPNLSATQSLNKELLFSGVISGTTNLFQTPAGAGTPHTGLNLVPNTNYCMVISQYGADSSTPGIMSLALSDSTGTAVSGSPVVTSTTNQSSAAAGFYYSAAATLRTQAAIGDIFKTVGTMDVTTGAFQNGTAGPIGPVAMLWGVMPNASGTPTASVVQSLCNGSTDIKTWALANGFTIHSLYRLNDAGTWAGDAAGSVTAGATVIGAVTQASPIIVPPTLTLNEQGPFDVFRVEPGQSGGGATGSVYFKGTFSSGSAGFAVRGVDCEVLSAGSPVAGGWQSMSVSGGTFIGKVSGVAAGGPYTQSCRLHNSKAYVYTAKNPVYVGLVIGWLGQSQQCVILTPGTGGTGATLSVGSETLVYVNMPLVDGGKAPTNGVLGHAGLRQLTANNTPGGGSLQQAIGDGGLRMLKDLSTLSGGWPIKLLAFCKSGTSVDSWAYDYMPGSAALTGSGAGDYTLSQANSQAGIQTIPNASFVTGFAQSILKGSLTITDTNGAVVAADSAGCADTCNLTGVNVTAGTIDHLTGIVAALHFSGSQVSPLTAHWTSIQDQVSGNTTQQNPYNGYGVFGDGTNPTSGYSTQIASRASGPMSMWALEQITSNANEVSALAPPTTNASGGALSVQSKWDYVINTKYGAFWWNAPNTPVVAFGYPRDTTNSFGSTAGSRQFLQAYGLRGGQFHFGGTYADDKVQCAALTCGPHEDSGDFGGMRMGRRMALNMWDVQAGTTAAAQPTITGAAFGIDKSHITISFNLPHGTSLATCGTALSGGTCTSTTANGTVVKGFRIGGSSNTAMYDQTGMDEGNTVSTIPQVDDTQAYSCVIASATTVSCAKTTGVWTSGTTYVSYLASGPFEMAGRLLPITLTNGGNTYSNGTVTKAMTGGGCTTAPTITFVVAGGIITSAARTNIGAGCTSNPTVVFPNTGTGGALTATVGTTTTDFDDLAFELYDNSGGFSGFEPGLPVTAMSVPLAVTG